MYVVVIDVNEGLFWFALFVLDVKVVVGSIPITQNEIEHSPLANNAQAVGIATQIRNTEVIEQSSEGGTKTLDMFSEERDRRRSLFHPFNP